MVTVLVMVMVQPRSCTTKLPLCLHISSNFGTGHGIGHSHGHDLSRDPGLPGLFSIFRGRYALIEYSSSVHGHGLQSRPGAAYSPNLSTFSGAGL